MALRNNNEIVKGSSMMVFMKGQGATGATGAANYGAIAFATSHSFNKTLNTNEVSTKDHGDYAAVIPGNIAWEATTENLYSVNGWKAVNDAFNNKTPVTVAFGPAGNYTAQGIVDPNGGANNYTPAATGTAATCVEYGQALITSLQVTAAAGDNATFTATFTGDGALSTTAPA